MTDATLNLTDDNHGSVSDYIALLKPRVMSLVVFTGLVGLMLAPGDIHPIIAAVAVLCIAVSSGAAGAVNMWYDRDIDKIMRRTENRPIPQGRVSPQAALEFGIVLSVASVFLMGLAVNWAAAAILASASLFYIFIYTIWLKRSTPQNIVIGGAAGAFPPMIGWAAVTGDISVESSLLFAIIFLWTPPHFWALALFANTDYSKAGVPMMPAVAGAASTKRQMLFYTLLLIACAAAPGLIGMSGITYLVGSSLMGAVFLFYSILVLRAPEGEMRSAKGMFGYSILYLFMLFSLFLVDKALMSSLPVIKLF